jgi:hypothetical protein
MSREIRISVRDDEVFEWMRRRKEELDLSWEEALRRGLGEEGGSSADDTLNPFAPDFDEQIRQRVRSAMGVAEGSARAARSAEESTDVPGPETGDIGGSHGDSGPASGEPSAPTPPEPPASPGSTLDRLEDAEDAVLVLPGTDDEGARVPLRVNLRTDADGLAVDVVAVRQGTGTTDLNRFAGGIRATVTRALAQGDSAALELDDGAESYPVRPSLTWGRDDEGRPTVVDAEVTDVVLEE